MELFDNISSYLVKVCLVTCGSFCICTQDSAFEGSVFTHADVKPGMLVRAKVVTVEPFGAIVQFSSGVKALCPLPHMSELEHVVKPPKKFKVTYLRCSFLSHLTAYSL
jgi:hypothetical protein